MIQCLILSTELCREEYTMPAGMVSPFVPLSAMTEASMNLREFFRQEAESFKGTPIVFSQEKTNAAPNMNMLIKLGFFYAMESIDPHKHGNTAGGCTPTWELLIDCFEVEET